PRSVRLPALPFRGREPLLCAVELAPTLALHHAFEPSIDSVCPAVIRTAELLGAALSLRHYRRRMVPASVIKRAQRGVFAACHDEDRKSTRLNSSHGSISYA